MPEGKKDIVLILGDGGMMGIFIAGVLYGLPEAIWNRVHSVYGTSSGADAGVYFIADQREIPFRFFTEYLTGEEFIQESFLRYLVKIFLLRTSTSIKDYVNVEYAAEVARNSVDKLNLESLEKSDIRFFVKVIDVLSGEPLYLPANTDVFNKLMATSQCGPLSSKAVVIDGKGYIDGGTIPNTLDIEIARIHPDKQIIFVKSQKHDRLSKALLYPLYLLAGHAIGILYGSHLGRKYTQNLFTDYTAKLELYPNVIMVKNDLCYSSFCTDKEKLGKVYARGVEKGQEIAAGLI